MQGEIDASIVAYSSALSSCSHIPRLGIAQQYLALGNTFLAKEFLDQITAIDPAVENERGVLHYKLKQFPSALKCFTRARVLGQVVECNIVHTLRMLAFVLSYPAIFNLPFLSLLL